MCCHYVCGDFVMFNQKTTYDMRISDWSSDVCSSDLVADPADSAPWPLGIPRLRLHADAPSRSALKLEEALLTLLDDRERARLLREGMHAADLGAAPGGWTWVLTRPGVRVSAIDNEIGRASWRARACQDG